MGETAQSLVELLERVAAGDKASFERLYRATSGKLFGIILRVVRNRSSADEILQEIYVKIWQRAGEFDGSRASPITWMATIARNRAIDEVRRHRPQQTVEIDEAGGVAAELVDPLGSRTHSEDLRALMQCLGTLPEERRAMILLAYCRGLSREALAQQFGKPIPTVKTWLHRGLAQLRVCLTS